VIAPRQFRIHLATALLANLLVVGVATHACAEETPTPLSAPPTAVTPAAPEPSATVAGLSTPALNAEALAAAVIRLHLEIVSQQRLAYFAIEQHGPNVEEPTMRVWANCEAPPNTPPPFHCSGTQLLPATPDSLYHVRAAAVVGESRQSEWTVEVEVHTPPEPSAPPAAPTQLRATARSPFDVELTWDDASETEYGFEVQRRTPGSSPYFEVVALQNPNDTSFVHAGRAPETEYVYRVRAFNPQGWSEFSNEVTVRTPAIAWDALKLDGPPPTPAPCTTLDAATIVHGDERDGIVSLSIVCHGIELGGHRVDAVTAGCGQNCSWTLYGEYDGCYRKIAAELTQPGPCPGFATVAMTSSSWPIISESAHGTAYESDVMLYAFVNGGYVMVDAYGFGNRPRCADAQGFYTQECEPKDLVPPFFELQFD